MDNYRIEEGFAGQIMHVLPRPLLAEVSTNVLVGELHPTDIGWFPHALSHYRDRPDGSEQHILIYCAAGRGWVELDGARSPVLPGQILLIPRGVRHTYAADETDPWSIYWVHFSGMDSDWFGQTLNPENHLIPTVADVESGISDLFNRILKRFDNGITLNAILYASQALRYLLAITFFDNPAFTLGNPSRKPHEFHDVISLMRHQLASGLTLQQMAHRAGLCTSRFTELFKKQTGFPPVEYYIRLRIQEAGRLLDTSTLSIKEVSDRVGFEDPYYFSRCFKKIAGLSPRHYRQRIKG
ncbi:AraC family transcriptional regulator [Pontiella sulfatireligans]|uniref:Arabinose operon regulatory protein n=1 Tax=Pontiella sulfatireligans TaxID=2750658 RepID=A0A6C2UFM7_9BACT|nr:helix-turn-helix domain-containing protein [Pontiella sulfatireligans]VGO18006.1 Arabinose operon regulatory protein [Pontiella sulfatireligans]